MKNMSELQTVSDIKGMHSIGARSIPRAMRSTYLELYVLDRERTRLEKENCALDRRRNNAGMQLGSIAARMEKLKKEIDQEVELKPHRSASPRKPLKTMSIKY